MRSRTLRNVPRRILFRVISGEPAFDLVKPGRTGRGEVHVITRSRCQPRLHVRMFVGSVVVEDQMNVQISIH